MDVIQSHGGAKLESEISAVLWFDSYSSELPDPPKITKVPLPAEKYCLYAAEDDLALRAEPSVNGYLWKRMVLGTELTSLEPKATAKTKVGGNNQWINVQVSFIGFPRLTKRLHYSARSFAGARTCIHVDSRAGKPASPAMHPRAPTSGYAGFARSRVSNVPNVNIVGSSP